MNPNPSSKHNTAFAQLSLLLVFAVAGLLVLGLLAVLIIGLIYGFEGLRQLSQNSISSMGPFRLLLCAQQIGLFLVPAILLSLWQKQAPRQYYQLHKLNLLTLMTVLLLALCSIPLISILNYWNQALSLPGFLKGLEDWMRQMENTAAATTMALLQMKGIDDLLVNIVVVALVPAICEEFLFRGALMRIFLNSSAQAHAAIWLSAAIFSFIHFQFFGFLPRLLLGAVFGYIYFWTKNLWYSTFAHFVNNSFAVLSAYYYQINQLPFELNEQPSDQWYGYFISLLLSLFLLVYLYKSTHKQQLEKS